eukprot:1039510-Pyramimonas_sp.AAC.1
MAVTLGTEAAGAELDAGVDGAAAAGRALFITLPAGLFIAVTSFSPGFFRPSYAPCSAASLSIWLSVS